MLSIGFSYAQSSENPLKQDPKTDFHTRTDTR